MQPDAVVEVRMNTTAEGGREGPVRGPVYGCVMFVDGEGFDCRLMVGDEELRLGETYELPVSFLHLEMVLPKLGPGKFVFLWEGKEIAGGRIARLAQRPAS